MKQAFFLLALFAVLLLFGCTQTNQSQVSIQDSCSALCIAEAQKLNDFNNGPCLGIVATDWVCDAAHNPRLAVDNLPANECTDFLSGKAKHFVEVDENCKVINVN